MSSVSSSDGGYGYYQKDLGDLEDDVRAEAKRNRERAEEAQDKMERRYSEAASKHEASSRRAVESIRENANRESERLRENTRAEIEKNRAQTYDRLGRMNREQEANHRHLAAAVDAANEQYNRALEHGQGQQERRSEEHLRAAKARAEEDARRLSASHREETAQLRSDMKDLLAAERTYPHARAEGRADAIREQESEWKDQVQLVNDRADSEISDLKDKLSEQDRYYSRLNNENLHDKDAFYAGVIARQDQEAHANQRDMQNAYLRDRGQQDKLLQQDRQRSRAVLEQELSQANEAKDDALARQAHAYQETAAQTRMNDRAQIDQLEKELRERNTTEKVALISPAAEAAVRKSVGQEYARDFDAERARNQRGLASTQQNYADRLEDAALDHQARETKLSQNHAQQLHEERTAYLASMAETMDDRDRSLRERDSSHDRMTESMNRTHARVLDHQRREYEDIIQNLRNDANTKITSTHQDAEFNARMAQKAFAVKQNELIREYEKKLADQKAEYDARLDDLTTGSRIALHDAEKNKKLALDDMSRGYEQRIAQMEFQQKERERLITQNYQDELEKVKRSNALLIAKKS